MHIRTDAEIIADFPDDSVEDETDIILFGGRGMAETIATMLRGLGYEVSVPQHQEEHGWDFYVTKGDRRVWMQVTDLGEMHILSTSEAIYRKIFNKTPRIYPKMLTDLNIEMRKDIRFRKIEWKFLRDITSDTPGVDNPVPESSN